jgi:hypothetical protein
MYIIYTLAIDVPEVIPLFARFPRSICTETLACERSTPALCSACVKVFNNLTSTKTNLSSAYTFSTQTHEKALSKIM